tara:strand:+ start:714 stop:953 length:240 start_codon:yes stop_codon:yes gene_type:complete
VKIFWPHRSDPKGFSIENLARKCREKISNVSSNANSNQLLDDSNLKYIDKDREYKGLAHLSIKRGHWANRDFSEYRRVV